MADSISTRELAARALRMAIRTTPGDMLFGFALAEELDETEGMDVHHEFIVRARGPLGGFSTRIPVTFTDMLGRKHNIMVQAYCDAAIDDAFKKLGITE